MSLQQLHFKNTRLAGNMYLMINTSELVAINTTLSILQGKSVQIIVIHVSKIHKDSRNIKEHSQAFVLTSLGWSSALSCYLANKKCHFLIKPDTLSKSLTSQITLKFLIAAYNHLISHPYSLLWQHRCLQYHHGGQHDVRNPGYTADR